MPEIGTALARLRPSFGKLFDVLVSQAYPRLYLLFCRRLQYAARCAKILKTGLIAALQISRKVNQALGDYTKSPEFHANRS